MRDDVADIMAIGARLVSSLDGFTDVAKEYWRPEILDTDLRGQMLGNARLEQTIVKETLLVIIDVDFADDGPIKLSDDLDYFLTLDLDRLIRLVGLAWHANQLAELTTQREFLTANSQIELDDIRFALRQRAYSLATPVETDDFWPAILTNGRACVSAWLNEFPSQYLDLFTVLDHAIGEITRDECVSFDKARVCSVCLKVMRDGE